MCVHTPTPPTAHHSAQVISDLGAGGDRSWGRPEAFLG